MNTILSPGEVLLGKYRIEKHLGQGGMGVVVAARHIELDQLFAIKCLLPSALANEEVVQRFLREARAAAGLHSEHVAHVVDVGRLEDGSPYMVMEYLSGCDLRQLVRRRGPLPVDEAARYVIEAGEAIAEAHAMGIVHRDIKPANLFLAEHPDGKSTVKVLDFGISKPLDPEGMALTKTGALMGSPLYMSPEQMLSSKDADVRSDVWSMGVVLYELCTGKVPFNGETISEVTIRVVQEAHRPPSAVLPGLPPELDAVMERCLKKSPDLRYPTMRALMEAVRPLAGISASPAPVEPTGTAGAATQGASAAIGQAATVALPEGPSQTLRGVASGSSAASRKRGLPLALIGGLGVAALVAAGLLYSGTHSFGGAPILADSPTGIGMSNVPVMTAAPVPSVVATPELTVHVATSAPAEQAPSATATASARPGPTASLSAGKAAIPRPGKAVTPAATSTTAPLVTATVKKPEGIF